MTLRHVKATYVFELKRPEDFSRFFVQTRELVGRLPATPRTRLPPFRPFVRPWKIGGVDLDERGLLGNGASAFYDGLLFRERPPREPRNPERNLIYRPNNQRRETGGEDPPNFDYENAGVVGSCEKLRIPRTLTLALKTARPCEFADGRRLLSCPNRLNRPEDLETILRRRSCRSP